MDSLLHEVRQGEEENERQLLLHQSLETIARNCSALLLEKFESFEGLFFVGGKFEKIPVDGRLDS